jgi:hypothetical protein
MTHHVECVALLINDPDSVPAEPVGSPIGESATDDVSPVPED